MRQRAWLVVLMLIIALFLAAAAKATFGDVPLSPGEATTPAPEGLPTPGTEPGSVEIVITAAGDVTLGGNKLGSGSNMYTKALAARGGDLSYFFANVQDYFGTDDLTIVNFEGTLTNRTKHRNNEFCFRAPPEHVAMLPLGSVEAVALENNHVMDYYQEGYDDTVEALTNAGIVYASDGRPGVYQVKGVTIGMLAYKTFDGQYPRLFEQVPKDIEALRAVCDIVIVSYHWGDEAKYKPNDNQVKLGRATIDAGADLVLGHHSHRVAPIECYNGKYIVYSLGNCVFSGNRQPKDMDTFLFQQKFTVANGQVQTGPFRVIHASISSVTGMSGKKSDTNDLAVTPFAPGSAATKRVIDKMLENGKGLTYAVKAYPTEWPVEAIPAEIQTGTSGETPMGMMEEMPEEAPEETPEEAEEDLGVYL